ncbi:hypothetical protein DPMN_137777 [Dreissena polymorpha]|uniref:Uncharacterized protein n=1 Tax=Dreissena polymorpha TaxID=45954 RepID=A0A9D4G2H4_DREPO|nr:hypothetical protein DPMN_137777 [Dreissena polymorpha]
MQPSERMIQVCGGRRIPAVAARPDDTPIILRALPENNTKSNEIKTNDSTKRVVRYL